MSSVETPAGGWCYYTHRFKPLQDIVCSWLYTSILNNGTRLLKKSAFILLDFFFFLLQNRSEKFTFRMQKYIQIQEEKVGTSALKACESISQNITSSLDIISSKRWLYRGSISHIHTKNSADMLERAVFHINQFLHKQKKVISSFYATFVTYESLCTENLTFLYVKNIHIY